MGTRRSRGRHAGGATTARDQAVWATGRAPVAVVALLTLLALALRLGGLHESLSGDELYAFDDVHARGLLSMLHDIEHNVESSPPLFFVMAWLAAHVGDPTETIRLPSIVLGAGTVPVVYLLGCRTVGRGAGLFAAGLFALDPLAVWQGSEARPYAALMFFAVLSALLLVVALESSPQRYRWWVGYAVSVAAVVYTHYTGVFVLAAQMLWAAWFYRERWRELIAATAGAVLLYVPWLPHYHGAYLHVYSQLDVPLVPKRIAGTILQAVIGHPQSSFLSWVPGTFPTALFLAVLALSFGLLPRAWSRSRFYSHETRSIVLIALLAVATPLAVPVYSAIGYNILLAHSLSASVPFELLLLAFVILALAKLHRLVAVVAGAIVVATIATGAVKMMGTGTARPNYRAVFAFAMNHGSAGDTIVDSSLWPVSTYYAQYVPVYFSHRVTVTNGGTQAARVGFARARAGGRVFVVVAMAGWLANYHAPPFAGPSIACPLARSAATARSDCVALRATRTYPGMVPVAIFEYSSR